MYLVLTFATRKCLYGGQGTGEIVLLNLTDLVLLLIECMPAASGVRRKAAAAAKTEAAEKVDAVSEKLGVDAPEVSMEAIDQAAELTKGKVAEGGAATTDAVKQAVGPAQ